MLTHLNNFRGYLKLEAENLRQLFDEYPENKNIINKNLQEIEDAFKLASTKMARLRESL
jgi:hypothetical protein